MKKIVCTDDLTVFIEKPFYGCDGKLWSDEFLQFHLDKAIQEEDYLWAAIIKEEQERRNNIK